MTSSLFAEMFLILKRYWRRYLLALCSVILANILLVINPLIFRHAIAHKLESSIWSWGALLVCIATVGALFRYWMRLLFISISREAERDLRERLFLRIQAQAQPFYDRYSIGDLMSRFTNDVALYREVLGPGIMYPAFFITLVIPVLIALFSISAKLALIALLPIVVLPPLMLLARALVFRTSVEVQTALGGLSTLVQESLSGIRLIKAYGREGTFFLRFRELCASFFRLSIRLVAITGLFFPFLSVIGRLVTIALIVAAAFFSGLTSADLVSFMWLQGYILVPVLMLGWVLPLYQKGRGAYQRLFTLYQEPLDFIGQIKESNIAQPPSLSLRQLTFSYNGGANALQGVTCDLPAGALVGITGPPASGKSTLLALLQRQYPLKEGMLFLSGVDICAMGLEEARKLSSAVEQQPFLFSRSLGENIALAKPNATPQELEEVIHRAALTETIAALPKGMSTLIGERGVNLSGGQKQRVALARALLVSAPLLLLDDPFSALDNLTIEAVMRELKVLRKTHTILLVSHQVSVLEQCDYLLCLVRGRLEEQGTPQELALGRGHFNALVELDRLIRHFP